MADSGARGGSVRTHGLRGTRGRDAHDGHDHDHDHDHHHGDGHHHHDCGHDHGHDHHHGCGHEHGSSEKGFHSHGTEIELDFSIMIGIGLLCLTFLVFGQIALWRGDDQVLATTCFLLSVFVGGAIPMLEALPALLRLRPDVESLMVFAALGACVLGEPREGAVLMMLFSLSRALEAYAVGRTRQSLQALKEHWTDTATRLTADGEEEEVQITDLLVDDLLLVRPGERIPLDAEVVAGSSSLNEAAITGEPLPVDKTVGDTVFGGTLNLQGSLRVKVTSTAHESTLARLIRLVEEAEEQEALTQRVVEWTTERYSTLVLLGTMFIIAIPYLYFRTPLEDAVYRGLSLLVVASPCALVIATPAAIVCAIQAAAKRGILLKGGVHLEAAAAVRVVALDKTGTLTKGEPRVTTVKATAGASDNAMLTLAAAVEHLSEHPLARPVVDEARSRSLSLPEATEFQAVTGRGVQGQVGDSTIYIGSPRWMSDLGLTIPADLREIEKPLEARGERTLFVAQERTIIGLISMADTIRPEAVALVRDLKRTGIRRVVMLTGDTAAAAEAIAEACGVDEVRAELLPADKLEALEELKREYGRVIMVGDGVNDAPALARADVGVAMGGIGSDLALESADVILMKDDLWRLPVFVQLARKATRMILFNLAFAIGVVVVLVATVTSGAATGAKFSLVTAVIGHEGSTMFVVLNSLRLLRWKSRLDHRL